MNDGGGGGERPPPSTFFCLRSNVRAITRLETLATQAIRKVALRFTFHPEFPRFSVKSPPQSFFPFCSGDVGKRTPDTFTVFILISAQPRISAHLEQAPIPKAEKVTKRPASNKRPTPPPHNQTQISAHPHATHLSE